jgi:hypothetical protein
LLDAGEGAPAELIDLIIDRVAPMISGLLEGRI